MLRPIRRALLSVSDKTGLVDFARELHTKYGVELIATGRSELDLADPSACRAAVQRLRPHWVLNAGAYTAVDKAESEPELAQAVNAGAPAAFAEALAGYAPGLEIYLQFDSFEAAALRELVAALASSQVLISCWVLLSIEASTP
jgi:hypothetical protein